MTCSCPKCHAQIELDLSRISEDGTFLPCQECKGRIWVNRECYARMALKKEGSSYCDKCGNELAHSIVCTACGVMYPDYYLVQASKPLRRQIEKPDLFSISFTKQPTTKQSYVYTGAKRSVIGPSKAILKFGLLALTALLVIGAGYLYYANKLEKQYAKNYMRALYTIKSGTEFSLSTCSKLSNEWQTSINAGQKYAPHINAEDESRLNNIKETIDGFMKTLNKPPKKFINSNEKLANLYGVYTRAHELAVTPSGSLSTFNNLANKSKIDFDATAQDLKNSLPSELSAELKVAQAKYKGLRDI